MDVENVQLHILVPPQSGSSELDRESVFYDEELRVIAQLTTPSSKPLTDSVVDRIRISVEVNIAGYVTESGGTLLERAYLIHSLLVGRNNLSHRGRTQLQWTVSFPVKHPRTRLQSPRLVMDAAVSLTETASRNSTTNAATTTAIDSTSPNHSRQSSIHQFSNDLTPIQQADWFGPLIADSLSKVDLKQHKRFQHSGYGITHVSRSPATTDLQVAAHKQLTVFPAVNLRLRCTKSQGNYGNEKFLTTLEVTASERAKYNVIVTGVKIDILDGSVVPIGLPEFPFHVHPVDSYHLSYQLSNTPNSLPSQTTFTSTTVTSTNTSQMIPMTTTPNMRPVFIKVFSTPQVYPDDPANNPQVVTKWDTVIDFDIQPIPTELLNQQRGPVTAIDPQQPGIAPGSVRRLVKLNRSTASLSSNNRQNARHPQPLGVTISFDGPNRVRAGETFKWKVFAINNSSSVRNLSLYFQAKEQQSPGRIDQSPRRLSGSEAGGQSVVVDLKALKRMAAAVSLGDEGIMSLQNDIRIGPLQPQACFETEIALLALKAGDHTIEEVTVVDLVTGDGYDCGGLIRCRVDEVMG